MTDVWFPTDPDIKSKRLNMARAYGDYCNYTKKCAIPPTPAVTYWTDEVNSQDSTYIPLMLLADGICVITKVLKTTNSQCEVIIDKHEPGDSAYCDTTIGMYTPMAIVVLLNVLHAAQSMLLGK